MEKDLAQLELIVMMEIQLVKMGVKNASFVMIFEEDTQETSV